MKKILMKVLIELMIIMMITLNRLIIRETRTEWTKTFSAAVVASKEQEKDFNNQRQTKIVEYAK